MAAIGGTAGSVMVGTVLIGEISEWALDQTMEPPETTAFGDTWKEFIGGLKSWSGTLSGNFDPSDTGQTALGSAFNAANSVVVALRYGSGSAVGTAYVTGKAPSINISGKADISYSFQGTGPLT